MTTETTPTPAPTPLTLASSKACSSVSSFVHDGVPVIDLAPLFEQEDDSSNIVNLVVAAIAQACAEPGFFQVINHGIPLTLIQEFRTQCQLYFQLDHDVKQSWKRHAGNSRGYFDDELTKQRRDWKECLDMGVPGSRQWNLLPDDAPENECLDGFNQLPSSCILPDYRRVAVEYFDACAKLSQRLAILMAQGLGKNQTDPFIVNLEKTHTSYLRSNYYPPCPEVSSSGANDQEDPSPLGISPHKDAGFLTVLLQDDDCHSLQVLRKNDRSANSKNSTDDDDDDKECWMTVHPLPGALTINTGDMAQIWSNNKYKAPLHRVLANCDQPRYSAPFFYNPGYQTMVEPATSSTNTSSGAQYHGVLWGYFRAIRFAGDLTDLGVEIQISDFCKNNEEEDEENGNDHKTSSRHLVYQKVFQDRGLTNRAFNVDEYREILKEIDGEKTEVE
jgi:isopenicillin N synthase-like dioxygenase